MTKFRERGVANGHASYASGSTGVNAASRRLCADTCDARKSQGSVGTNSFLPTRRRAPSPLPVFNPSDWKFVLREWWHEPRSASGRWYEYELHGPLGCAVGVGDTALAAVTDAGREYMRRFEQIRVA